MNHSFRKTARQTLKELEQEKAGEIVEIIEEVAEQGFNHDKVKMIKDRNGDWVYRLKVDKDNTNHRIFMDYIDGELKILDVLHRSVAYEDEYGNG
ncbi:MAG: type II toxin-antitoxin system RelE/ParE family toxin [Candidatus Nanohalobium sp.]